MSHYHYETVIPTPASKLYSAITDIANWPRWDDELESTTHDGALTPGSRFSLKPKGGPNVQLTIEAAEPCSVFRDVAHLPLAKMTTTHEFQPAEGGTRVRVRIDVSGPLGFLWDRIVARKQAQGLQAQTRALARFAEIAK